MIKVVKNTRKHECCSSCGILKVKEVIMHDIKVSTDGQGFNTITLCPKCMRELRKGILNLIL